MSTIIFLMRALSNLLLLLCLGLFGWIGAEPIELTPDDVGAIYALGSNQFSVFGASAARNDDFYAGNNLVRLSSFVGTSTIVDRIISRDVGTVFVTSGGAVWASGAGSVVDCTDPTDDFSLDRSPVLLSLNSGASVLTEEPYIEYGSYAQIFVGKSGSVVTRGCATEGLLGTGSSGVPGFITDPRQFTLDFAPTLVALGDKMVLVSDGDVLYRWGRQCAGDGESDATLCSNPTFKFDVATQIAAPAIPIGSFVTMKLAPNDQWGAALTQSASVTTWGLKGPWLCQGPTSGLANIPEPAGGIALPGDSPRITGFGIGEEHLVVLDADQGEVLVCGSNDANQLGTTRPAANTAIRVEGWPEELEGATAVQVGAGRFYSIAVMDDGRVVYWGSFMYDPSALDPQAPTIVEDLLVVEGIDVHVGDRATFFNVVCPKGCSEGAFCTGPGECLCPDGSTAPSDGIDCRISVGALIAAWVVANIGVIVAVLSVLALAVGLNWAMRSRPTPGVTQDVVALFGDAPVFTDEILSESLKMLKPFRKLISDKGSKQYHLVGAIAAACTDEDQPLSMEPLASSAVFFFEFQQDSLEVIRVLVARDAQAAMDGVNFYTKKRIGSLLSSSSGEKSPEIVELIRGPAFSTRMLVSFARVVGMLYLRRVLRRPLARVISAREGAVVDQSARADNAKTEANLAIILDVSYDFLAAALVSIEELNVPIGLLRVLDLVYNTVKSHRGAERARRETTLFFFRRFLCPAIAAPNAYGLVTGSMGNRSEVTLSLVAKLLGAVAASPARMSGAEMGLDKGSEVFTSKHSLTMDKLNETLPVEAPDVVKGWSKSRPKWFVPEDVAQSSLVTLHRMTVENRSNVEAVLGSSNQSELMAQLNDALRTKSRVPTLDVEPIAWRSSMSAASMQGSATRKASRSASLTLESRTSLSKKHSVSQQRTKSSSTTPAVPPPAEIPVPSNWTPTFDGELDKAPEEVKAPEEAKMPEVEESKPGAPPAPTPAPAVLPNVNMVQTLGVASTPDEPESKPSSEPAEKADGANSAAADGNGGEEGKPRRRSGSKKSRRKSSQKDKKRKRSVGSKGSRGSKGSKGSRGSKDSGDGSGSGAGAGSSDNVELPLT